MNRSAILRILSCLMLCLPLAGYGQTDIYEVKAGEIHFFSEAPKELISASSKKLKGFLDLRHKTFAFKLDISSFVGFNNPLQRGHFNENYMESNVYPAATFKGKIIEDVDFEKEGSAEVRAKGKLMIHGVEQERIIKVQLTVKKARILAKSDFAVLLTDHNIKIPRVVNDKLSPEIKVAVEAILQPQVK
ncbi:YceI family protein [Taibaiella koreensis]|uniref:YceI family protein n=1 Tax=Taibaiella koreensis TaxID=1268548 RepID=UPI00196926C8|nr:YceI family protein [Taibaiella koreensis]